MTLTENALRELLAHRVAERSGNPDRVNQVHDRIRRTHRRRQAAAGVLALAVAGTATGLAVSGHGSTARVVPATRSSIVPAPSASTSSATSHQTIYPAPTATVGTVPAGKYGVAALAEDGPPLLNATGGAVAAVAPPDHGEVALALSYDSGYLAMGTGQDNSAVEVTDLTGRALLTLTTSTYAVAWSPSADVLAVVANPDLRTPVTVTFYRLTASGHTTLATQTLAGAANQDQHLSWSPDGTRLAVGSDHEVTLLTAAGTVIGQKTFGAGAYPVPRRGRATAVTSSSFSTRRPAP